MTMQHKQRPALFCVTKGDDRTRTTTNIVEGEKDEEEGSLKKRERENTGNALRHMYEERRRGKKR